MRFQSKYGIGKSVILSEGCRNRRISCHAHQAFSCANGGRFFASLRMTPAIFRFLGYFAGAFATGLLGTSHCLAQTSPAVTSPPSTGQQESPVPRYVGPSGVNGGAQWERWDLNAHLNGRAPITPQLAPGTTGSVNGVINVATYGAECDARQGTDGSTTAGSTTFSAASGAFTSSDAGKLIDPSQSGVALGTTIVAILSPTSVQMSSAATATTTSAYWTAGTDNTAAINAGLAAVPASVTGGGAVYTPSVNPARPGWSGRCLIKNGVTILKQGTFLIGDGPYVSIWQCSTGMTNDCVTIAGFTATPTGVQNMGIISDAGGNGTNACLTLSGDAGIFVDRNWFQGCMIGLNVANTSSYHITNNVSELSQIDYQFTGTSAPGVLLGNESYHNNSGGKGFYFNGVNAAQKLVADANFDTGTTGNLPGYGSGLFVLNSSDLDLGTFVENYSNVVAWPADDIEQRAHPAPSDYP